MPKETLDSTDSSLFNPDTSEWDQQKIQQCLNPILTIDILKIIIGSPLQNDRWIWTEEKNGILGVLSAYKLNRSVQNLNNRGSSSSQL